MATWATAVCNSMLNAIGTCCDSGGTAQLSFLNTAGVSALTCSMSATAFATASVFTASANTISVGTATGSHTLGTALLLNGAGAVMGYFVCSTSGSTDFVFPNNRVVAAGTRIRIPTFRISIANTNTPITPFAMLTDGSVVSGALTAIPRYKIAFRPGSVSTLFLVHGRTGTGASVWTSVDGGNSWVEVGTQNWTNGSDYHSSIDVDSSGRIYVSLPCSYDGTVDDPGVQRLWNGSSWDDSITFDDFSGTYSQVNIIKGNGNDVFAFVRSTNGGSSVIYWHRSTDNGATWSAGTPMLDTGDGIAKRMGSSYINGQPACLIGYDAGSVYRYRHYRWDGVDSFDAISDDYHDAVSDDAMNRIWGFVELSNGQLHLVYRDIVSADYVLRHTYRDLAGTWGAASTLHTLASEHEGEMTLTHVGNTLCLAYMDTPGATRQCYYRTWTSGGGWSSATQFSSSAGGACGANCNSARVIPGNSWPITFTQGNSIMFGTVVI